MCCRVRKFDYKSVLYLVTYTLQVSKNLPALATLHPAPFQLQSKHPTAMEEPDDDEVIPDTSLPCVWKQPKSRKDSSLPVLQTHSEIHEHSKPVKRED